MLYDIITTVWEEIHDQYKVLASLELIAPGKLDKGQMRSTNIYSYALASPQTVGNARS